MFVLSYCAHINTVLIYTAAARRSSFWAGIRGGHVDFTLGAWVLVNAKALGPSEGS
jgi:hypothetical protein